MASNYLNVFPAFSFNDGSYLSLCNPIFFCQNTPTSAARRIFKSYFNYLLPGKFAVALSYCFIHNIISLRTEIKMVWVNTTGIITSMIDLHAFVYFGLIVDFITKSMSIFSDSVDITMSVTKWHFRTCPKPASFSFIDSTPKSFFQCKPSHINILIGAV